MATLSKEEQEKRKKQAQEYYASRPDTQTIKKLQNDYALASDLNTLSRKQESEKGYVNNELRNEYSKVTQQVKSNESLYKQYFGESAYNSTIKSGIDALTKYNSSALTKDEKKEQLKENKKSARKDTFNSWLEYMQARITKSDDEDATERQYQSDKSRYKEYKEQQKENYYTDQSTNTETLQNDKEAAELVEQLYESKQTYENAQEQINTQMSSYNNSSMLFYLTKQGKALQEQYDNAYANYEEIKEQLEELGYDAPSLLNTYTRTKNEENTQEVMAQVEDFSEEHPFLSGVAYVGANLGQYTALEDIIGNGIVTALSDDYIPLDTNSANFIATNFRNTVSETNTENLKEYVLEKTDGNEEAAAAAEFLYQSGLSAGDMLSVAWMPQSVSLSLMFTSAAASTAVDATNRGLSADQAMFTSLAAGAAEVIFEKVGLENFKVFKTTSNSGVKNAIINILKQTFTEGSEEAFTDIANAITDQIINGDDSAIMQEYQSYIDSGMSEAEARKKAAISFGSQVGESFLGGALVGGVMGGAGTVVQKTAYNSATYNTYGENIKNSENAQETIQSLIDTGLESNDKSDKAYKLASEIQGKLNKNVEKTGGTENGNDVLTGSSIESTQYDYSKVSSSKLGELAISVQQQNIRNNINLAIDGTTNAEKVSKAVKHLTTGGSMSVSDARAISNSPTAVNAINEQLGTNFATTDITTKTLKNISTALASGQTDLSYLNGNGADLESEDSTEFEDYGIDENGNVVKNQSADDTYTIEAKHDSGAKMYVNGARPLTIDGGELYFNTADGKVSYDDAEIQDTTTREFVDLIKSESTIDNTGANAIFVNYKNADDSLSISQYFRQADIIYQAGRANNMSFTEYKASHPQFEAIYTLLGDGAENIYRSAQTDNALRDKQANKQKEEKGEKKSKKKTTKAKGGGTYTNNGDIDSDVETVLKTLAKVTGYDYISKSERGGNGHIISDFATVVINTATGKEYQTAIHENVHYIAEHNQEGYENLKNALLDWYKENSGDKRYNTIKERYAETYEKKDGKMTNAELDEELVADATAAIFTTEDGIEQFAEYVAEKSEPEKKSIKEAFTDLINRIVETIKKALSRASLTSYQKEYLEMEQKQAEEIRTLFLSSLDKAAENYKSEIQEQADTSEQKNNTAEGDAQLSLDVEFDDDTDFTDNINTVANMKSVEKLTGNEFKKSDVDLTTQVTEYFNSIGNVVHSKYGDVILNRTGVKASIGHGIGRNKAIAFKAVPSVIENGQIIGYTENYKSRGYDSAIFAAPVDIADTTYFVAAAVQVNQNSNEYSLHEVAITEKENEKPFKTGNSKNTTPSGNSSSIYSLLSELQNVKENSINPEKFINDISEAKLYDYSTSEKGFEKAINFYKKYQNGTANKDNFYFNTMAEFEKVNRRPSSKPDYVSTSRDGKVSSEYWYTDEGIIRGSNHWGNNIGSCDWKLEGIKLSDSGVSKTGKLYGFAKWSGFVQKTQTKEDMNGDTFVTDFENVVTKNVYKINGKMYEYNYIPFNEKRDNYRELSESEAKEYIENNTDNNFDEGVKNSFDVDEPVEEVRDLVAVHNITEDKMLKSLELGGLPMPSIAVMEARNAKGNDTFGEISLIFPREAIDPEANSDNKVYGSDVWSPTYPTVEYKLNEKKADEIYSRAREASKKKLPLAFNSVYFAPQNLEDRNGRISIDNPQDSIDVKLLYLAENDINVEKQTKENRTEMSKLDVETSEYLLEHMSNEFEVLKNKELTGTEWLKEYGDKFEQTRRELYKQDGLTDETIDSIFASEKGFEKIKIANRAVKYAEEGAVKTEIVDDTEATYKLIDKSIDEDDYNKWVDELFDGIIEKKGIRNDKDAYTSSGNRRSWETLHYEENLENVVKQMKSQENGDSFLFGGGELWAVAAKQYGTIEEVKADSNRLQTLTDEEYSKIKQEFGERFTEIANSILNSKNNDIIVAYTNITDAVRNSKTKSGVLNYLKTYYGDSVNANTVDDILDLVADIGNMPVSYFEAKPQRALDFNEVATALIPESSSQQLRDGLDNAGVNYIEYDGKNENSRQDALNDYLENVNDVRFSLDVDEYDIDEYDETEYNNVTLSSREYNQLQSEVMTNFPNVINVENEIRLASTNSVYLYILDDNYNVTVLSKGKILGIDERNEINNVDGNSERLSRNNEISGYENGVYSGHDSISSYRERTGSNAQFNSSEVSEERRSNEAGYNQTNSYDNSTEKNSIDVEGENRRLRRENKKLNEVLKLQKHELELTGGLEISASSATEIGRWLNRQYNTKMSGIEIGREIKKMGEKTLKIMSDPDVNISAKGFDTLKEGANAIAEKIVNEYGIKEADLEPEIKDFINDIRSIPVKLNEAQKAEVIYTYGSYKEFRRAAAGKIKISNNATPLDIRYTELKSNYPGLIPDAVDTDQATTLIDLVDGLKMNASENPYGVSNEEYVEMISADIIDKFIDLRGKSTFADKKQKEINKTKSEYKRKIAEIKKSDKEKYEKALEKVKEQNRKLKDEKAENRSLKAEKAKAYTEIRREEREKLKNSEEMSKTRESIRRSLMKVSTLTKQEKTRHIPNNLVEAVRDLIETVAPRTFSYESAKDQEITQKLDQLTVAFTNINESKGNELHENYNALTNLFNDAIKDELHYLRESVGGKTVNQMNLSELKTVDQVVKVTLKTIQDMNKMFGDERKNYINSQAQKVSSEIKEAKKINASERGGKTRNFFYGSMKPAYFFKYLGSKTLEDAYNRLRKGEDKWAVITYEAKQYANEVRQKYDWKNWDFKGKQELKTTAGETLNLNLPQLMAIYANSRREQNKIHMLNGGIEFTEEQSVIDELKQRRKGKADTKYDAHKISEDDITNAASMLTTEQKEYVQEMVEYLSTTMAEYGNEVSREMYDVELFKEQNYYPARVDKDTTNRNDNPNQPKMARHIINSGFTKSTVQNASNPLILDGFDDVWAGHINEMATYNAFAVEVENFNRVFNYKESENHEYSTIRTQLKKSYGAEAEKYIDKLLDDINGGVMNDSSAVGGLLSKWKKTAVGSNLSVVVQQPSAIGRALSVIDTKYFAKTAVSKRDYEEIKKYAPVAIIKEMGYFDTNMAQSTVDYLNNPEYDGLKEKVRGFFTDGNYRDEAFGYLAGKADEMTWAHIWNACKAESRDIHSDLSVDEQLEKAGERFTQVITETQVYDSVFSRSQWMRSKDGLKKLLTAFMAEPTTSYNMLQNAIVQRQRGTMSKKQSARIVGSLVAASMINAIFQSLVTAARDDDDDKSYLEKYISEIPGDFLDNVSPLNWLPIVKDIISIFNGYDVSRSDMALISDVYDALEDATDENKTLEEKAESIVGAFGNLCGIPLKNIIRDTKSVINVVNSAKNGMLTTMSGTSIKEGIKAGVSDATLWNEILSFFGVDVLEEKDKNQLIYEAILNGDDETYNRIANNLENPDNYIKQGLIENDVRVAEAGIAYASGDVGTMIDTADELESDGFDYELALKAIKSYSNKIETAAKKLNEDDESGYNDAIAELTASGADRDDVIEAVENVEVSESEESSESALYSSDDLYYAVKSKNEDATNAIIDNIKQTYIANGKSEDDAEELAENRLETAYTRVMYEDVKLAEAAIDYSGGDVDALIDGAEYFEKEDFDYDLAVKAIKKYVSTMESAKKAKNEGDTLTYNDKLEDLLAGGIDKDTLEKAIDKIEVDTSDSDSSSESKLYSGDDLYNAVKNGNTTTFKTVFEANVKTEVNNGKTQEEAEETVKKSIQTKFKKDYQSETSENREKIVQKLKNTGLYDDTEINKMIADSYTLNGAITDALDTNDATTIQKYVNERISAKVAGGMDEDNAKYGLKTSIMNAYKDEYLSGDADTKAKIISIMVKTGIYGNRSEVLAYIKEKWTE